MRIAIRSVGTREIAHVYEAAGPEQARFGGPWGDPALFEHVEHPPTLAEVKSVAIQRVRKAGFRRIQRDWPVHRQRRLALEPELDAARTACRDQLRAVKATVDAAKGDIAAATDASAVVQISRDAIAQIDSA